LGTPATITDRRGGFGWYFPIFTDQTNKRKAYFSMKEKQTPFWQSPAVRGFSFMSLMRYGTKAFSLLRLVVVARLLGATGPYQLGTFGIVLLVIAITEVFTQTGINLILIKDRQLLYKYIDTAWIVSILRGFSISGIIWLITPWLVHFYANPNLEVYLHWAVLIPILRGFINPAIISFQQELQFGKESLLRTSLQFLDIGVGFIFLLLMGNALGLLYGVITGALLEVLLSFVLFKPWPTIFGFKLSLLLPLFRETKFVIVNGMVTYLNENLDDILIGKLLGTAGLGFYQTAYKFSSAITIEIGNTLRDTLYPIYAKIQSQPEKLAKLVDQVQMQQFAFSCFVILPSLFFARPAVSFFLGEQWLIIVPALQILLLSGSLRGIMNAWFPLFLLRDKVSWNFYINSLSTIIMIIGIGFLSKPFGLFGAAMAIFMSVAFVIPFLWLAKKQVLKEMTHHD
jgi:PST family polysaccharide transporter/lipopolysaccharide exporter